MSALAPRPAHYRWCDVDGAHIALFSWVEQVMESAESAALLSRLLRLLPDAPDQCLKRQVRHRRATVACWEWA
jgi:hypothetical protein